MYSNYWLKNLKITWFKKPQPPIYIFPVKHPFPRAGRDWRRRIPINKRTVRQGSRPPRNEKKPLPTGKQNTPLCLRTTIIRDARANDNPKHPRPRPLGASSTAEPKREACQLIQFKDFATKSNLGRGVPRDGAGRLPKNRGRWRFLFTTRIE